MSEISKLARLHDQIEELEPMTWDGGEITAGIRQNAIEMSVYYRSKNRRHDDGPLYATDLATGSIHVYVARIETSSTLAFHLHEARRARHHPRQMNLDDIKIQRRAISRFKTPPFDTTCDWTGKFTFVDACTHEAGVTLLSNCVRACPA